MILGMPFGVFLFLIGFTFVAIHITYKFISLSEPPMPPSTLWEDENDIDRAREMLALDLATVKQSMVILSDTGADILWKGFCPTILEKAKKGVHFTFILTEADFSKSNPPNDAIRGLMQIPESERGGVEFRKVQSRPPHDGRLMDSEYFHLTKHGKGKKHERPFLRSDESHPSTARELVDAMKLIYGEFGKSAPFPCPSTEKTS